MSVYIKENPLYFSKSIDSMLAQTEPAEEIVIVKDGKLSNQLEDVISNYTEKYPHIFTIVALENNVGLGKALNKGLEICRNELVARMDTDDISLPSRCSKQLDEFEKNSQLCICGTQIMEFQDEPDQIISLRHVPLTCEEIKQFAKRRSPFNHPTVMFKKSFVLSLGGYAEYGRKEDLDLFIRMVNEGGYALNINEALLLYRTNENNLKRRKTWQNCSEYIKIMYKFYRKHYLGFNDLLYVFLGQMFMYLMPDKLVKKVSDKFLRKNIIPNTDSRT